MRISDWSSDVCSSDLPLSPIRAAAPSPTASRSNLMTTASPVLDSLAQGYWDFRCDEFPVEAILSGAQPRSDLLLRDAPEDHERRAAWASDALGELAAIDPGALSQTERATFLLLRGELAQIVDIVAQQGHLRDRKRTRLNSSH